MAGEEIRVEVVGEDVGGGCIKERGRLKDNDIVCMNQGFKIIYDSGLCVFGLLWGSGVPVFGLTCIISECVDNDNVSGFECQCV